MKKIDVVAGIIRNNENKLLITRRKQGKLNAGKWEFPGGKIENGETPEEALLREIKEELNIEILVIEYFAKSKSSYKNLQITLLAYFCNYISGEIVLTDHDDFKWITLLELKNFDFSDADIFIIKELLENRIDFLFLFH